RREKAIGPDLNRKPSIAPANQVGQIELLRAIQVVEAILMTGENDELQRTRGVRPVRLAAGGASENFKHLSMLAQVGVGERVIEDGDGRSVPRQQPADGQADQQAQLFQRAV